MGGGAQASWVRREGIGKGGPAGKFRAPMEGSGSSVGKKGTCEGGVGNRTQVTNRDRPSQSKHQGQRETGFALLQKELQICNGDD